MNSKGHISEFGIYNGQKVHCITLKNSRGTELQVMTLRATWNALKLFDKNDHLVDVVVRPKTLKDHVLQYRHRPYYFGSTVGRYAGRISDQHIMLNGRKVSLEFSNGVHFHGGSSGMHSKIWHIDKVHHEENPYVSLSCASPHLEVGYPGNLSITATYTLTEDNHVMIVYEATTDADTILNLTNHVYFNLGKTSLLNHNLQLVSESILETDDRLIPSGNYLSVTNTPYDFGKLRGLKQITKVNGLDTCYVLKKEAEKPNAALYCEKSGIRMEMYTNQRAVVIFAPSTLEFAVPPKEEIWERMEYPALCMEAQNFPDAPNHTNFPSSILKKEEVYRNETMFNFSLKDPSSRKQ